MRYYSIKGAAMRKMEENMGIFKDDDEKTTENVSLPEDLNLDDIGDDLGSLFDEDKADDADIADDNVDKDLLSQIFSDGGDVSESDDKTSNGEMDEDLSKLLGEIEDIEDVAKESAAKEAEKKTASNHKKNNKKADKVKENRTAHMDAPGEVSDDTVTVISQGTTVNGGINSAGAVDVMGTINGDITSRGKVAINGTVTGNVSGAEIYINTKRLEGSLDSEGTVQISEGTVIIGNVTGTSAYIAGAVKGTIDVQGAVVLEEGAVVKGDVIAESLQINQGAVLDGSCSLDYTDVDIDKFFA